MPPDLVLPQWLLTLNALVWTIALVCWCRIGFNWSKGRAVLRRRAARPVPWGPMAALPACFFAFSSAVNLLDSLADQAPRDQTIDLSVALSFLAIWLLLLGVTLVMIVATKPTRPLRRHHFGLPRGCREATGDAALGVLGCMVALVPTYVVVSLLTLAEASSEHPIVRQLFSDPEGGTLIAAVLTAVVMAPIFEEFAFRVLLQGWLERVAGRQAWWPILVSSLMFALAHSGQGWAPVPLFFWAIVAGYLYRQTHSYLAVVALHMFFNGLQLLFAFGISQTAGLNL